MSVSIAFSVFFFSQTSSLYTPETTRTLESRAVNMINRLRAGPIYRTSRPPVFALFGDDPRPRLNTNFIFIFFQIHLYCIFFFVICFTAAAVPNAGETGIVFRAAETKKKKRKQYLADGRAHSKWRLWRDIKTRENTIISLVTLLNRFESSEFVSVFRPGVKAETHRPFSVWILVVFVSLPHVFCRSSSVVVRAKRLLPEFSFESKFAAATSLFPFLRPSRRTRRNATTIRSIARKPAHCNASISSIFRLT